MKKLTTKTDLVGISHPENKAGCLGISDALRVRTITRKMHEMIPFVLLRTDEDGG